MTDPAPMTADIEPASDAEIAKLRRYAEIGGMQAFDCRLLLRAIARIAAERARADAAEARAAKYNEACNEFEDEIARLESEVKRLREALTPSSETKFAYIGEFMFKVGRKNVAVPWDTIKDIMKFISARAALTGGDHG